MVIMIFVYLYQEAGVVSPEKIFTSMLILSYVRAYAME
jgi:hypothetical protein